MPGSRTTARIVLVLSAALLAANPASSADLNSRPDPEVSRGLGFDFGIGHVCETDAFAVEVYPPAPRYVYDNRRGPTWTGNGWASLPVGEYPPDQSAPRLVAPPPPHGFNPTQILAIPCRVLDHLPDYLPPDLTRR